MNLNGSSQPTRERTADSGRLSRLPSRKSRFAVAEGRLDHQHYRAGRKRNKRPGWQNRADKGTAPAIARYKTRLEILAPVDGRIVGLQVHSPGGVIQPGQALMDIVPEGSPLVAEAHIPVDKITEVYVGQEAQAQLDAFERNTTPMIPAKVLHIAADRQEEQTSMGNVPFYLSILKFSPESAKGADGVYLSPGMPVIAFITTKKQTILSYMLEPLLRNWDRALRE